jgi:UDP-N-acetylmuramate--alanine ligase
MHYHIVGIGGAGMSAIAHVLLDQGHTVSGSDQQLSAPIGALERRGVKVAVGHHAGAIAGADALLVTSAARADNVEIVAARAAGMPVLKRADLWREWSRERKVVAVAGSSGKTTTTAMIALALDRAGLNPGFVIGGEAPDLGMSARWGDPAALLVIEADEYDHAFLALRPHVAVITNVAWDHVDIYPTAESYIEAFQAFAQSVADPRKVILCGDDAGALQVATDARVTQYGIDDQIAANPASCRLAPLDWSAARVTEQPDQTRFEVWQYDQRTFATRLAGIQTLRVPGVHNVRNALAALAACAVLGVDARAASEALAAYRGVLRRFELKGEAGGITIIDDYAHHPAKVRATLAAARARYPGRRIVAYIQPHTYSRTRALLDEWPGAFDDADLVLVGEIYAARERDTLGMSDQVLAEALGPARARAVGGVGHASHEALALLQPGDVFLTLSAGDGTLVGERVLAALGNPRAAAPGQDRP